MTMDGDVTWSGEHTIQYTDDALCNCTPETYVILLAYATAINAIKKTTKISQQWMPHKNFYFLETLFKNFIGGDID